jgi:hypothetical protein
MESYDEIKAYLQGELDKARKAHASEYFNRFEAGKKLRVSMERYDRFVLHGMIPADLTVCPAPGS